MARDPMTIGPYRIHGILGRGGMGVVFRAEHTHTGQRAAVKTVVGVKPSLMASIRREIRAASRMRHPGVVRVLDHGVLDGRPWYAMQLLRGRPLSDILTHEPGREGTEREVDIPARRTLLALVRDTCAPLAYMHGQGLVHRDLKPDNIFVEDRGTPVLVDFGIAGGFSGAEGREMLAAEGVLMGTCQYMAPEQITGELVDGRTDLYALGCILYECLTGRPPFYGGPSGLVLQRHLHQAPVAPSRRARDVEPALDALVMRLLAKQPGERPGFAEDVARRLDDLAMLRESPMPSAWSQTPLPPVQTYLHRPAFSGRDEHMHTLIEALDRARAAQRGQAIILCGEPGVGKTRLAMEIAREAVIRDVEVITGHCRPLDTEPDKRGAPVSQAPLHPLRPVLQAAADLCHERGQEATEALLGSAARVLMPYAPELATVPGVADMPALPPVDTTRARTRVFRAVGRVVSGLAERAPLMLVIDDIQWADELTIGCLTAMASNGVLDGQACLLIATSRRDEHTAEIDALCSLAGVTELSLSRLDHAGVCAMAASMLGLDFVPPDIEDFLFRASSGNPFFVAEYLRAAAEHQLLTRDHTGTWTFRETAESLDAAFGSPNSLPTNLMSLIERRLSGLDARAYDLVQAAAVLGTSLSTELLLSIADQLEGPGQDVIHELCKRHILEPDRRGQLAFAHATIRDVAYERLEPDTRQALHRRAAQAIEAEPGDEVADEVAGSLGVHWSRAGEHARAFACFMKAAEHARRTHANAQAASLFRAAIDQSTSVDDSQLSMPVAEAWERLADVAEFSGAHGEVRDACEHALAALVARPSARWQLDRARLLRRLGDGWQGSHEYAEALSTYERAEHALGQPGPDRDPMWWHEWIELHIERCTAAYFCGAVDQLTTWLQVLQPAVETRGTADQRAHLFQTLVQRNLRVERYMSSQDTVEYAEHSLAGYRDVGDPYETAVARFTYAAVLLWNGALDRAERELLATLDDAERLDDVTLQTPCLAYLSVLYRRQRDVYATRVFAHKTAVCAETTGMVSYLGAARANQGWAAFREAAFERATEHLMSAVHIWRDGGFAFPFQWLALFPLVAMEVENQQFESALERVRALLEPRQRRLPEPLARDLEHALGAREHTAVPDGDRRVRQALERVVLTAKSLGYL